MTSSSTGRLHVAPHRRPFACIPNALGYRRSLSGPPTGLWLCSPGLSLAVGCPAATAIAIPADFTSAHLSPSRASPSFMIIDVPGRASFYWVADLILLQHPCPLRTGAKCFVHRRRRDALDGPACARGRKRAQAGADEGSAYLALGPKGDIRGPSSLISTPLLSGRRRALRRAMIRDPVGQPANKSCPRSTSVGASAPRPRKPRRPDPPERGADRTIAQGERGPLSRHRQKVRRPPRIEQHRIDDRHPVAAPGPDPAPDIADCSGYALIRDELETLSSHRRSARIDPARHRRRSTARQASENSVPRRRHRRRATRRRHDRMVGADALKIVIVHVLFHPRALEMEDLVILRARQGREKEEFEDVDRQFALDGSMSRAIDFGASVESRGCSRPRP